MLLNSWNASLYENFVVTSLREESWWRPRLPIADTCLTHFIIVVLRVTFKCSVSEWKGYVRGQVQSEASEDSSLLDKQPDWNTNARRHIPLAYVYRTRHLSLIKMAQAVTLLTCIREILDSKLVQDNNCPEWDSLSYSLVSSKKYPHSMINLDTTAFFQILTSSAIQRCIIWTADSAAKETTNKYECKNQLNPLSASRDVDSSMDVYHAEDSLSKAVVIQEWN
jgi:hypothetical protein